MNFSLCLYIVADNFISYLSLLITIMSASGSCHIDETTCYTTRMSALPNGPHVRALNMLIYGVVKHAEITNVARQRVFSMNVILLYFRHYHYTCFNFMNQITTHRLRGLPQIFAGNTKGTLQTALNQLHRFKHDLFKMQ
jgi:hypothetical protein